MRIRHGYIYYLIIFVSFSCQKEIDIDIQNINQKLVVNSFFTQDDFFNIRVSKSLYIFNTAEEIIDNANVVLYENNLFREKLVYSDSGFYKTSITKPEPGISYSIKVNYNSLPSVSAISYIPEKTIITDCKISDFYGYDNDGIQYSQLSFTLADNETKQNYYEILLYLNYNYDIDGEHITRFQHIRPFSDDPVILNEGDLDYYPWFLPFSDNLFNGKSYNMSINYYTPTRYDTGELLDENYKLIVHLRSVSEEYYNFKKKLIKHLWNQDSDIWDGIGEPIQMYSNIENGYGIFAGYSVYIDTVQAGK